MPKFAPLFALSVIALLLLGVALPCDVHAQVCPPEDTLRWTLVVPPSSINPNTLTGPAQALLIFMEYLGVQGVPMWNGTINQLTSATDWITYNQNYTTWAFNIKPGLKWSNGLNVTSADLLDSFSSKFYFNSTYDVLAMGPEVKSEYALNSSAAVFELNAPDAQWANKMSVPTVGFGIFPSSIVDKYGPAYSNLGTNIVSGPFYVSDYKAGEFTMTLLRNPYYNPQPSVCEIDINFVETLSQTAQTVLAGVSDWAPIVPTNAAPILNAPNLHILREPATETTTLEYNNTVYPFNMTQFRQALVYGINQTELVQTAFDGYGHTAYDSMGVVPSVSNSIWYNPNIKKYSYDMTQSLALLSSIGITKGSDGLLHYPTGEVATLTIWAPTDTTVDTIGAGVLKSDLEKLGFNVVLQSVSSTDLIGDLASNVNNIARTGIILFTYQADDFGFVLDNVLPGPAIYWIAPISGYTWEWPANIQARYQSNMTAIYSTDDQSLLRQYAWNVQAINAEYLPTITLAYPDQLYAYSTARFTGWIQPPEVFLYGSTTINPYSLVTLVPNSVSATSTGTTGTATTTPTMGNNTYWIVAGAFALVIIAAVGIIRSRRKKS